jgi:ketosteroid isomerase-like protein
MAEENTASHDEAEIRRLIADQQSAVCAKDVDRIMSHYAAQLVVFNVKPPFQIRRSEEWRRVWETSLSHFPASFGAETRDLTIAVSGELAVAHYALRFTGLAGEPFWIRATAVYRRIGGGWLIVHEHNSVPFDPETLRPVFPMEA